MTPKSCVNRPRLPQRRRAGKDALPHFRVTTRDWAIVEAVYHYRALSTKQVSDLCFAPTDVVLPPAPSSRCLHRLKLLFHANLLQRVELPNLLQEGRRPFLYRLDKEGALLLANLKQCGLEELDWRPGEQFGHHFLEHLLATNDVRIALVRAAARHKADVVRWLDDKTLKTHQRDVVTLSTPGGRTQQAAVVPDGYFHLTTGAHHYHNFLEVDMGTVTGSSRQWSRRTWARKVAAYMEYYRSGKYHARYHTKSLRVLTVTASAGRLAHLRAITAESGGKSRFWFTTLEQAREQDILVDAIWTTAADDTLRSLTW